MNCSMRFFELTMAIDANSYSEQLDRANRRAKKAGNRLRSTDLGLTDETLLSDGILVNYHDNLKKKKIRLIALPCAVIGDDDLPELWTPSNKNISRLVGRLDKLISAYFNSDYALDDFTLTRVDFAADIDVGNQKKVIDHIKLLHNIGRVKCFSPLKPNKNSGETKENFFGLAGNTNGVEFRVYSPKNEKRILRAEVRLTKKDTIRAYAGDGDTIDQISSLASRSAAIFMDTFRHVVPRGDYYKKLKAEKLIIERVSEAPLRRRMIRLLVLIPEKKSLHLAQKALDARDIKCVMAKFAEIGVSPVTISKRHDIKRLDSLYGYIED